MTKKELHLMNGLTTLMWEQGIVKGINKLTRTGIEAVLKIVEFKEFGDVVLDVPGKTFIAEVYVNDGKIDVTILSRKEYKETYGFDFLK